MLKCRNSGGGGLTPGTTVITGGTNTRVLFDDNGVLGEDAGLTYVKGSATLTATGLTVTNAPTFSAMTSGRVAFFGTAGLLSDSANITANTNGTLTLGLQLVLPAGSSATPAVKFSGDGRGFYFGNGAIVVVNNAGAKIAAANSGGVGWQVASDGILGISATTSADGSADIAFSRLASGKAAVGTGAAGNLGGELHAGMLQASLGTALTLTAGAIGMSKMTASGSAPGASGLKLEVVCGTNAGSAKLIAYAGTSTSATTVLDNIGSGVTGC